MFFSLLKEKEKKKKSTLCSTDEQKCHCQIPHCRSLSGRALLKKQAKIWMCIVALDFCPTRRQQLAKVYMCNKLYTLPWVLNHCVGSNLFFKSLTPQLVSWHFPSLHHLATDASYLCTDAEYPPNPNISLVFWTNWANTIVIKMWIIRKLTWLLSQLILILYHYILLWTILHSSHFFESCKCISLLKQWNKSTFCR